MGLASGSSDIQVPERTKESHFTFDCKLEGIARLEDTAQLWHDLLTGNLAYNTAAF